MTVVMDFSDFTVTISKLLLLRLLQFQIPNSHVMCVRPCNWLSRSAAWYLQYFRPILKVKVSKRLFHLCEILLQLRPLKGLVHSCPMAWPIYLSCLETRPTTVCKLVSTLLDQNVCLKVVRLVRVMSSFHILTAKIHEQPSSECVKLLRDLFF